MEYIHYYTNAATLFRILDGMRIKLSYLSKSTDLVERKYYMNILDPERGFGKNEAIEEADQFRYVCFCQESSNNSYYSKDGASYINMWDYYADRHKGACIRIDYKNFIQKNNFLIEIPIDYSYSKEEYFQKGVSIQKLMAFKDKMWNSENEIRFIRKRGNSEDYCTIRGCIDKVFLGVDFDKEYDFNDVKIDNLKTLCDLAKRKKDIDPHWFFQPLILENGNLFLPENGGVLWHKMMKQGVYF